MLSGDFFTYETKASQSGGSAHCRVCFQDIKIHNIESTAHILTSCVKYDDIRERIFPEYDEILKRSRETLKLRNFEHNNETLCQFILDPTSMNLKYRILDNDPTISELFKVSRDLCFAISKVRRSMLNTLNTTS